MPERSPHRAGGAPFVLLLRALRHTRSAKTCAVSVPLPELSRVAGVLRSDFLNGTSAVGDRGCRAGPRFRGRTPSGRGATAFKSWGGTYEGAQSVDRNAHTA